VRVKSAVTGEVLPAVKILMLSPSGSSSSEDSDAEGLAKFRVRESGDYRLVARLGESAAEGEFRGLALSTTVMSFFSSSVKTLFGAEEIDSPWLLLLLLLLSAIAAILSYTHSRKVLDKGIVSSKMERRRVFASLFVGAVFFSLPFIVFRGYGIGAGSMVALLETALVLAMGAYSRREKRPDKIKV